MEGCCLLAASPVVSPEIDRTKVYISNEQRLFLLVLFFSRHWKQLNLTLPFSIYQKLESHMSRNTLPILQIFRAVVHMDGTMASSSPIWPPITFMEAPNLQWLYLNVSPWLSNKIAMFPSTVWNQLTDVCFIYPISNVGFYNLIQHCCSLITCEVQIERPWDYDQGPCRLQTDMVSLIKVFELYDGVAPVDIFQLIYFPSLVSMHYRCPPRYQELIPVQPQSLTSPRSLFTIIENASLTIQKLNINPRSPKPLTCLHIASEINHLFFDITPSFHVQAEEDIFAPNYLDFNIFAISMECEDILVPKLEVLEIYGIQELTDKVLLHVLISRIDATQRGDVSPLWHVKMQFSRQRQKDIREAILEQAKSAGFEMELELHYAPDSLPYEGHLSPSFSLPSTNFDSLPIIWPPDWE